MFSGNLALAQTLIDAWPGAGDVGHGASDAVRRLRDALQDFRDGAERAGWRDVGSLIRQILLTDQYSFGGTPQLVVPANGPWPSLAQWRELHCRAISIPSG